MGGFKVPFFVLGGFVWACVAGNYFVMPKIGNQHEDTGPMIQVMKLPAVWVVLLASSFTMLTYSAMDAVLAPHLKQLGFSVIGTSLLFGGWGVTYALTAVLWGYIVDKKKITRILMVLGAFASAIGLLLTGPSPFLNIPQSTTLICIVFPATSCVIAMITVPTLPDILITTKWHGIPDSLGVNSVVSGLWFAASSFGSMMGPIISGTVTDYYGFAYTTTVLAGGFLAVMLLMCFFGVWEYQCGKGRRLPKHRLVVEATEEEKVTLLSKET